MKTHEELEGEGEAWYQKAWARERKRSRRQLEAQVWAALLVADALFVIAWGGGFDQLGGWHLGHGWTLIGNLAVGAFLGVVVFWVAAFPVLFAVLVLSWLIERFLKWREERA